MSNAYSIVREFEERVADFAGVKYGVAVDCCSNAIFLCASLEARKSVRTTRVEVPCRTYVSVPFALQRAGFNVSFYDLKWSGRYIIHPINVIDGAKRFRRDMWEGGFHCLSFHIKKHLPIGRGGMILTDDADAAAWFKRMRYDGREEKAYSECSIAEAGYHMYMTPEQAARGLALMDVLPSDNLPDLTEDYPDLRTMPVFQQLTVSADQPGNKIF